MRGHGIGGQLLAALVEQAGEDGYPALSLSVERGNPAISLYERHVPAARGRRHRRHACRARGRLSLTDRKRVCDKERVAGKVGLEGIDDGSVSPSASRSAWQSSRSSPQPSAGRRLRPPGRGRRPGTRRAAEADCARVGDDQREARNEAGGLRGCRTGTVTCCRAAPRRRAARQRRFSSSTADSSVSTTRAASWSPPVRRRTPTEPHTSPIGRSTAVPVFGAMLKAHRRRSRRSRPRSTASSCRGSTSGRRRACHLGRAGDRAIAAVVADPPQGAQGIDGADLRATSKLVVYQTGLVRGVAGTAQLADGVEVTNGGSVRDMVFVHANAGKVMNRYTLTEGALHRRSPSRRWPTRSGRKATSFRAC